MARLPINVAVPVAVVLLLVAVVTIDYIVKTRRAPASSVSLLDGTTPAQDPLQIPSPSPPGPKPLAPDTMPPQPPTNLQRTKSAKKGTLQLSWQAASDDVGVVAYRLYHQDELMATVEGTSYSDEPSERDTRYAVSALDAAGNESSRAQFPNKPDDANEKPPSHRNRRDAEPPSSPTGFTAVFKQDKRDKNHTIELSWSASTDNIGVTEYNVYRDGSKVLATANTRWSDSDMKSGATHTYHVKAVDAAGNESKPSESVSVEAKPSKKAKKQ